LIYPIHQKQGRFSNAFIFSLPIGQFLSRTNNNLQESSQKSRRKFSRRKIFSLRQDWLRQRATNPLQKNLLFQSQMLTLGYNNVDTSIRYACSQPIIQASAFA
jgi:hypothetical protein